MEPKGRLRIFALAAGLLLFCACSSITAFSVKTGRIGKARTFLVCPWPKETSEWFVSEFQIHPHGDLLFQWMRKRVDLVAMPKDGSDARNEGVCRMARYSLAASVRLLPETWKTDFDAVMVSLPLKRADFEKAASSIGRPAIAESLAEAVEDAGQNPSPELIEKFSTDSCASSYLALDRIWAQEKNCSGIVYLGPRNQFRPVLHYQSLVLDGRTAEPLAKFRGKIASADDLAEYAGFVAGLFR